MSWPNDLRAQPRTSTDEVCIGRATAEKALEAMTTPRATLVDKLTDLRAQYATLLAAHAALNEEATICLKEVAYNEGRAEEGRVQLTRLGLRVEHLAAANALLTQAAGERWPWWQVAATGAVAVVAVEVLLFFAWPR